MIGYVVGYRSGIGRERVVHKGRRSRTRGSDVVFLPAKRKSHLNVDRFKIRNVISFFADRSRSISRDQFVVDINFNFSARFYDGVRIVVDVARLPVYRLSRAFPRGRVVRANVTASARFDERKEGSVRFAVAKRDSYVSALPFTIRAETIKSLSLASLPAAVPIRPNEYAPSSLSETV